MNVTVFANTHVALHTARGGMERSTLELVTGLAETAETGSEITVIAHGDTDLRLSPARLIGVVPDPCPEEYDLYGEGSRKWLTYSSETSLWPLVRALRGTDLILNCSHAVAPAFFGASMGIPVTDTCRLMPWHPCYALTAPVITRRVYLSEFQRATDRWIDPARGRVVRDHVSALPRSLEPSKHRYAVSVGRVSRSKGHHHAVDVARELGLPLVIVGDEVDTAYCQRLAQHGARLAGPLAAPDVYQKIEQARVLIWTPDVPEPGGRVVVEALRLGTPVVGFAYGVLHDMLHDGTARTTPQRVAGRELVLASGAPALAPASLESLAAEYWVLFREVMDEWRG